MHSTPEVRLLGSLVPMISQTLGHAGDDAMGPPRSKLGRACIARSGTDMVTDFATRGRVGDPLRRTVNFKLRAGGTEICGCVTFEALQRLSRIRGDVTEIAEQIFDRHRLTIEAMALARYAAGDFRNGVVGLDAEDFPLPANAP